MGPRQRPRRVRPRPDQPEGPRRLRQGQRLSGSPTVVELREGLAQLDRHLAFLTVRVADVGDPDLGVPLAEALQIAPAWIERYERLTIAQSGVAPPGMPAAFVLQYLLDPLATVVATAAMRTPFALSAETRLWSLDLDPVYAYPVAVQVRAGGHRRIADDLERHEAAWQSYRAAATGLATGLPTPTKMSSRQRLGMVEDMWEQALARTIGRTPPRRLSCCLMYALPGCLPCAGCPRTAGA
ncbi:hypothetical protein [Janibacter terrae]|uniref:hypothetical protein n=1 Tax=Janibacter terrae TaxID=103817 RepID=UPI0008344C46|nr:hypothetical protein [Janibacter terrae]